MNKADEIDALWDHWAAAGGTAAHPAVKRFLKAEAKRLGVKLPH